MTYLLDTDVLIDLVRDVPGCDSYLDSLGDEWSISVVSAMEFICGARDQHQADEFNLFVSTYDIAPLSEQTGMKAYWLLRSYSRAHGLRELDSLIAATALVRGLTLVTRNERHYRFIPDLRVEVPGY